MSVFKGLSCVGGKETVFLFVNRTKPEIHAVNKM